MGCFSLLAQNFKSGQGFNIDKNFTSFWIANLVEKVICEHPTQNNSGSPDGFSPHIWTITLIMEEGTDVTHLSPIITIAPNATLTSKHAKVQDFSNQVEYVVLAEDGSTVKYKFLAIAQEKTRASYNVTIYYEPASGAGYTIPTEGYYQLYANFSCTAYPNSPGYGFSYWNDGGYYNVNNPLKTYICYDCNIVAFFNAKQYTVTVQSDDTNRGTVSGGGVCNIGGSVYVTASPNSGWEFEGWYLNGTKITGSENFYYQPSSSCTLIAKFNLLINGSSSICSGSTNSFSVPAWQSGYTWSVYGNASIVGSNTNSVVAVMANNSATDPATIFVHSGSTVMGSRLFTLGAPPDIYADPNYNSQKIDGSQYVVSHGAWWVPSINGTGPFYYRWFVEDATSSNYNLTYGGPHATIDFGGQMSCVLWVEVSNSCGTDYASIQIYSGGRGGASIAYPNPVSDILYVKIGRQAIANAKSLNTNPTFNVCLFNGQGIMLHNTSTKGEIVEFNVKNLPDGMYYLQIHDGSNNKPERQPIVVKH